MLSSLHQRQPRAAGKRAGVVLVIFLLLGISMAACSPAVHQMICAEAGQPDDFCAVKQLQSGSMEAAFAHILLTAGPPGLTLLADWAAEVPPPLPRFRLSPARAPPSRLLPP